MREEGGRVETAQASQSCCQKPREKSLQGVWATTAINKEVDGGAGGDGPLR